jgi:hypothetical protein
MNLSATKLKLSKQLMDTQDAGILNHIKAVFLTQSEDWWEQLPEEIKKSVNIALKQSDSGLTVTHSEAMKQLRKWSKK